MASIYFSLILHESWMLAAVALFYMSDYLQVSLIYSLIMAEKPERQSCADAFKFLLKSSLCHTYSCSVGQSYLSKLTSTGSEVYLWQGGGLVCIYNIYR